MEGLDDGLLTMAMTKPERAGSALWMRGLAIAASAAVVICGGGFVALRYLRGGNAAVKSNGTEPSYSYHPTTSEYFDPGYSGSGDPATFDEVFCFYGTRDWHPGSDYIRFKIDEFWEEYMPDEDGNPDLEYGKVLFARATILEDYGQDAYNVLFRRLEHLKGEGDTEEDMAKDYPWLAEAYEEFKNGKIVFMFMNKSSNDPNLEHDVNAQEVIDFISKQDYFITTISELQGKLICCESVPEGPNGAYSTPYKKIACREIYLSEWRHLLPFANGKLAIGDFEEFWKKNDIFARSPKDDFIDEEAKYYLADGVDFETFETRLRQGYEKMKENW